MTQVITRLITGKSPVDGVSHRQVAAIQARKQQGPNGEPLALIGYRFVGDDAIECDYVLPTEDASRRSGSIVGQLMAETGTGTDPGSDID